MKTKNFTLIALFCVLLYNCGTSKAKVDPFLGTWNMVIEDTPQGDIAAEMTISKEETNDYICQVKSDVGTFNLNEMVLTDSKIKGNFVAAGMEMTLSGTFEGSDFRGFVSGEGFLFDANGKKSTASN